jgi:hypothetical protein
MKFCILPLTRSTPTAIWCEKVVLEPFNGIKTVFGVLFEVPGLFSILRRTEVSG